MLGQHDVAGEVAPRGRRRLPELDIGPADRDVVAVAVVLRSERDDDRLARDLAVDRPPPARSLVLELDRLERARDGARAAPRHQIHRAALIVEENLLDQVRPRRVPGDGDVAVELNVALADDRAQVTGRRVVAVVDLEVVVHLRVALHGTGDVQLVVRGPAPLRTRAYAAQPEAVVFAAGLPPARAPAVALPVKGAAGVDQTLGVEVGAAQQIAHHRVLVVQLWVGRDDRPQSLVTIARLRHRHQRGECQHSGQGDGNCDAAPSPPVRPPRRARFASCLHAASSLHGRTRITGRAPARATRTDPHRSARRTYPLPGHWRTGPRTASSPSRRH